MGHATVRAWRSAGEAGDASAAAACLARDVQVRSPLTDQFRFRGREPVRELLSCAFEVVRGIEYHTEVGADETFALFFHAHVGGDRVEEAQLLRLDADGLIREVTLFGRPLPALTAVMAGIGPRLLRRQRRRTLAGVVAAAAAPLNAAARLGDRTLVARAAPRGSDGEGDRCSAPDAPLHEEGP